ncbi:MAG: hypothetical protein K9N21_15065 [Deltaproteobacteria bacterium]|nr:hypothetical protein [Deltaproteobacteria bacterium]
MGMERHIVKAIAEAGPLTGAELLEIFTEDMFRLWQNCMRSPDLFIRTIGPRYLRLDRRIEGFARLSPSILREFLTYSVIGLAGEPDAVLQKINEIRSHIEAVTRSKSELAYEIISAAVERFEVIGLVRKQAAVMIAGDIVYNMAHDVPRPERSTGRLVKGSDMDIVIVVDDQFPKRLIPRLDEAVYEEKQRILMTPHLREEIDYIVKDMDRVREQVRFDTFRHMVACKILQEGTLLYGSEDLFCTIKGMLKETGVTARIMALEDQARDFRDKAERDLLSRDSEEIRRDCRDLFYPTEESEEFE